MIFYADLFAIAFWPLIGIACGLGLVVRCRDGLHPRLRKAIAAVALGLLLMPLVILIVLFRTTVLMLLEINGRRFETTRDLYEQTIQGKRIRAEIGKGSGMMLGFETLRF